MARSFDSGVGSSIGDSVRLVSMPATRSAAVTGEVVRIGGGRLEFCGFALLRASGDAVRQKATKYRPDLAPIIAKDLATYLQFIYTFHFLCFRLRLATLTRA